MRELSGCYLLQEVAPKIWIARELAISFLRKRGNVSFPDRWLGSAGGVQDAPQNRDAIKTRNVSGRGSRERLIKATFNKLFPNGIPNGTTSMKRDEAIQKDIEAEHGRHLVPKTRTIQKTLQKMQGT